jgi:hypothetical protein
MKSPEKMMSRQEMAAVLEEIARDPNAYPSARVSAIRLLNELGPQENDSSFRDLYAVGSKRQGRRPPRS